MKPTHYLFSALVLTGAGAVSAETPKTSPIDERDRFQVYGGVVTAQTPIRVDRIDVVSTADLQIEDIDVDIGDQIDVSTRTLLFGVTYRPIPIIEISAATGFTNTESDAALTVSGSFPEPLPILGEGFSLTSTNERDASGISYQAGIGVYVPINRNPQAPVVARAGVNVGLNDLDSIETRTMASSLTLIHSREMFARQMSFAVGVTHLEIDRVVEFRAALGGGEINVRQEQSLDNPWSLSASLVVPTDDDLALTFTTSNNFEGMSTFAVRLGYRF